MPPLKPKKVVPLQIPPLVSQTRWIVVGLDLSLSRTGWSVMMVERHPDTPDSTVAHFLRVGSIKPDNASDPIWVRSSLIGRGLMQIIMTPDIQEWFALGAGLILAFEAPTPRNDFLTSLNRIVHSVFFAEHSPFTNVPLRILSVNASTLRSVMGLTKTGPKNKSENITRAYDFVQREQFPQLDSDSCDAVLLGMMGRHTASIMLGCAGELPENVLNTLCNATQETKGSGRNSKVVTKGIMHRKEYWYTYSRSSFCFRVKDAANPRKTLHSANILI